MAEYSFSLAVKWENKVLCVKKWVFRFSICGSDVLLREKIITRWRGENGRFWHLGWEDSVKCRRATIPQKWLICTVTLRLASLASGAFEILCCSRSSAAVHRYKVGRFLCFKRFTERAHTPAVTQPTIHPSIRTETLGMGRLVSPRRSAAGHTIARPRSSLLHTRLPRIRDSNPRSFSSCEPLSHSA